MVLSVRWLNNTTGTGWVALKQQHCSVINLSFPLLSQLIYKRDLWNWKRIFWAELFPEIHSRFFEMWMRGKSIWEENLVNRHIIDLGYIFSEIANNPLTKFSASIMHLLWIYLHFSRLPVYIFHVQTCTSSVVPSLHQQCMPFSQYAFFHTDMESRHILQTGLG